MLSLPLSLALFLTLPLSLALPSPAGQVGHALGHRAVHGHAPAQPRQHAVRRRKHAARAASLVSPKKRACAATASNATLAAVQDVSIETISVSETISASSASTAITASSTSLAISAIASTTASTASTTASTASTTSTALFPWGTGLSHWTTSDNTTSYATALKPLLAGKLASTMDAPDGTSALFADFPADTYGLTSAGFSFYTEGAYNDVTVVNATEVMLSYAVWFEAGFEFNKGGKMPGLFGGESFSQAKSCSGGRQDGRDSCFSARLMWRTSGLGEAYDYLPVSLTGTDDGYGESIDRGAFTWATGQWQTVAQRIKLNDVGSANGQQEIVIDGESMISLSNVTFSTASDTKIYGIMAQTFFGGHDSTWASPQDQKLYFKDWSLAVLA